MTRTLLTYGDSNTFGTEPFDNPARMRRFGPDARWPRLLAEALDGWDVVEEGLPGRTTCHDDPVMGAHMNGETGLRIALQSHGPLDGLVIMLGSNDFKTRFAPSPDRIVAGIAGLLDIALSYDIQIRHRTFPVLVVCPPNVVETGPLKGEFIGAEAMAPQLAQPLAAYCTARGVSFFDANSVIATSPLDGVHFDADAHGALAKALVAPVMAL